MDGRVKAWLHDEFCKERKGKPQYVLVMEEGPQHQQSFWCRVSVAGLEYTGTGRASSKKGARTAAAANYLQMLIEKGVVLGYTVPGYMTFKLKDEADLFKLKDEADLED